MTCTSFQLKPTHNVSLCGPRASGIVWTFERDVLPPLLEQKGVPLTIWQETYEAVYEPYKTLYTTTNMILHAPPCIFLSFPYIYHIAHRYEQRWVQVVKQQSEIYQKYGIAVSVAREPRKSDKMKSVGLEFCSSE